MTVCCVYSDTFYLQYFDAAFPDLDFSELQPGQTDEQVGDNIQALIDLLAEEITRQDLSHISGLEIACGDPDHCLELLQIMHQLTVMMAEEDEEGDSENASAAKKIMRGGAGTDGSPEESGNYSSE